MKNNKKSAGRKLFPAISMLTVSAVMLSTATYAWFTMSKEVEVTGIQLTATTPELIEISFGKEDASSAGTLVIPSNAADAAEWVHSAATGSVYSAFGKIIPASSVSGQTLYYTNNATNHGKDVADTAVFSEATKAVVKTLKSGAKTEETGTDPTASTTNTDEGYFVDIPVWFRTTKDTNINLGVNATIQNVSGHNDYELYKAARISILDPNNADDASSTVKTSSSTSGVILDSHNARYYNNHQPTSITDDCAVNATKLATSNDLTSAYGVVTKITQTTENSGTITAGDVVAVVAGRTAAQTSGYSDATKKIIRVWLEGEDQACWNKNASQDFVISLKFYDIGTP